MDFEQAAQELEIELSEYISLLKKFGELSRKDLARLGQALAASDYDGIHTAAHSIKGASASLSLWAIYNAATQICETAKNGSTDSVMELSETITTEIESISRRLSKMDEGPADDA